MKKSELKKLMNKCYIFNDYESVCDFVSEVLYRRAKEIEATEPYATKTIKEYEDAAYKVFELIDYIEGIMEGEDEE